MENKQTYQVAIVGGGPVGLFLGCCLQQAGISYVILEKRAKAITHSRSIGIHPVSLELFDALGIAQLFIDEGINVKKGMAFVDDKKMGTLSFEDCPPPFSFILTLPQYKTERLLASHLHTLNPNVLKRNSSVIGMSETAAGIELNIKSKNHAETITAQYVVGCDGKDSFVRDWASIPFTQKAYDDTYIMGDFFDNTGWGPKAAIFLCQKGLIESFPLSKNMRRWVVKTDAYVPDVSRKDIEHHIFNRINRNLRQTENVMLSSFGVQKGLAKSMAKGRVILAGDAAHIISPIGGQGMNLGWLDAYDLTQCFKKIFESPGNPDKLLKEYSTRRLKIARKVIRRAEFNMALGRTWKLPFLKKMILWPMLKTPLSRIMANMFTMRGLNSLPF